MQRYFVSKNKDNLILSDSDCNHIKKIMRMKNKDIIEVVFDKHVYQAEIIDIDKVSIKLLDEININNDLVVNVTIAQALVREQKWDLIIQKITELGVHEIIPLSLERCNINIESSKEKKKIERWNSICKEASEQSFRNYIPNITNVMKLNELVKLNHDLKLFCSTIEIDNHLKKVLQNNKKYDNILIVIGPEGGLTDKEEQLMIEQGFISVSLGKTILRTETAPIFVMGTINYENWS